MANRGPNGRPPGNDGNGNMNMFERNKYRQTMPSRFNPISPPDNRNGPPNRFNTNSPTQSFVSTATTYEQPWSSPQFQSPAPPDEPRFRRTHSMAAKKSDKGCGQNNQNGDQTKERPKINFKEFGKKFTNKFKKNNSKNEAKKGDRMSAPVLSLAQSTAAASASQPQLPSTKPIAATPTPAKKKTVIKASASMQMQPEDKMRMYQKMARQQIMKESSLQRMQRERQRDFSLVPPPGKVCPGGSLGSNHSIDSVLVFNTSVDSRRSTSLSMTDDDVEPVFKNSLTNKNVTSSQYNNQQKMSAGPSFTSTPRLAGSFQGASPTISNVRSVSDASLCFVTSEDSSVNRTDSTMYFSADTLNAPVAPNTFAVPRVIPKVSKVPQKSNRPMTDITLASTASTPTGTSSASNQSEVPLKRVKEEVIDNMDNRSSSNCPSFTSSTPTSDSEGFLQNQGSQNNQPEHLSNLWMVSKEIRDKQLQLQHQIPLMDSMRSRAMALDQQKMLLYESKGDNPSVEDLRNLWNLDREFVKLNQEMGMTQMAINEAHNMIPYLEMRRNELLSVSPPPQNAPITPSNNYQAGSFV